MSPGKSGYSTSSFLHTLLDKDQHDKGDDAGIDCEDDRRALIRFAAAEDLSTERAAEGLPCGQQEALFSRRRSLGQLNPNASEHRRPQLDPKLTRRFSQQEKSDKGTTRRRSHGDRHPPIIRFISSTVHIVYGSDSKQKQNTPGVTQKIDDTNFYNSDFDCKRYSEPAACGNITGSDNDPTTIPYHRADDDDNNKSKGDIDDHILAPFDETSDASKWFSEATTDFVSTPISKTRTPTHRLQADLNDGSLHKRHDRNLQSLYEEHLNPAVSQWTTCRTLLSHDDDDDGDDIDGNQDDDLRDDRALLQDLENMSVLSQAADDDEEEEEEANSKSRATSVSSSLQVPMSDAALPSSLGWIHDRASGRLSRMTTLTTASGRAGLGGGGRKRRPLLLPPIMLPPIFAGKPTPLVVRDELWFARASGAFRNRPISDRDWDRLWDCRYLRIPRRPARDAIKV